MSYAEELLRKSLDSALTLLVGPGDWEEGSTADDAADDEVDLEMNRFMSTGLTVGRRR